MTDRRTQQAELLRDLRYRAAFLIVVLGTLALYSVVA